MRRLWILGGLGAGVVAAIAAFLVGNGNAQQNYELQVLGAPASPVAVGSRFTIDLGVQQNNQPNYTGVQWTLAWSGPVDLAGFGSTSAAAEQAFDAGCLFPSLTTPPQAWACVEDLVPPLATQAFSGVAIENIEFECTGSGTVTFTLVNPPDDTFVAVGVTKQTNVAVNTPVQVTCGAGGGQEETSTPTSTATATRTATATATRTGTATATATATRTSTATPTAGTATATPTVRTATPTKTPTPRTTPAATRTPVVQASPVAATPTRPPAGPAGPTPRGPLPRAGNGTVDNERLAYLWLAPAVVGTLGLVSAIVARRRAR